MGHTLSGAKQAAFARLLLHDRYRRRREATSALDRKSQDEIMETMILNFREYGHERWTSRRIGGIPAQDNP